MTESEESIEVLVDTNVATWAWFASRKKSDRARAELARFGDGLTGRTLLISGQTRAELLQLMMSRPAETRDDVKAVIDSLPYLPLDRAAQEAYAELYWWARDNAHPIHQHEHDADRWIASVARSRGLPLATADGVFQRIPGVRLISRIA